MPPWRLFVWVKLIEVVAQLRPRALLRWALHPDPKIRHAIRWYCRMGRRVAERFRRRHQRADHHVDPRA